MLNKVTLGQPVTQPRDEFGKWVHESLRRIENESAITVAHLADQYTISNHTPTRSLNMATATATDIGNFIATFISDLKNRGSKRRGKL